MVKLKKAQRHLPKQPWAPPGMGGLQGKVHKAERRLARWLLRLLWLGVGAMVVLTASWLLWGLLQPVVEGALDLLLLQMGVGWGLLLLWALALRRVTKKRPLQALRYWHRWLGALLLTAALIGALSYAAFEFFLLGRWWTWNLGGQAIGGVLAGSPPLASALRLLGLAALGVVLLLPRHAWTAARGALLLVVAGAGVAMGWLSRWVPPLRFLAGLGARARRALGFLSPRGKEDTAESKTPRKRRSKKAPASSVSKDGEAPAQPGGYQGLPPAHLLRRSSEVPVPREVLRAQGDRIEQALSQYGIEVKVKEIRPGPTVTLYGLVPGWVRRPVQAGRRPEPERRVTVDAILAREKDLALALAAPSLRFEAPVPGESVVGVEVPNPVPSLVTLGSVMESRDFRQLRGIGALPLGLGKGSGGDIVAADLAQMPHLLVAGATGSGKSVLVHGILASLLMQFSPWDLRLVMVDPKRVELTHYNGIPHLVTPVVVDADRAVKVLRGAVLEMTHRLRLLEERGSRNIAVYNQRAQGPHERMPYLVIVVDEMADLMMAAPNDIEHALCRLAQLGRATGIHLVVATQRPSVDVITGLIKANFPSRISFAVSSQIDSRTILDSPGAEKLLGRGDMLFLPQELPKPKRIQGAYVSDEEIHYMVEFWKNHAGPPPPPINMEPQGHDEEMAEELAMGARDELLDTATELAQRYSHISTSLLQRRLRIGYPRAARLREELEEAGVIAPDGEVLGKRRPQPDDDEEDEGGAS